MILEDEIGISTVMTSIERENDRVTAYLDDRQFQHVIKHRRISPVDRTVVTKRFNKDFIDIVKIACHRFVVRSRMIPQVEV
jgi:hypothetical protein